MVDRNKLIFGSDIMELNIKHFNELTTEELFELYKLRVSIFVVEQNCPYQEIDNADKHAFHLWLKDENDIIACLRVLPKGIKHNEVSIGRVMSTKRRSGIGTKILNAGIAVAREKFNAKCIVIEAQTYAREFYENVGFIQKGNEFLEDGIPHIPMILTFEE